MPGTLVYPSLGRNIPNKKTYLTLELIGANDVANSFATSVSSRSLTMKQAVAIASVMEFTGSVAVGSRVSETIRTKIIDPHLYDDHPDVLLLAMMCAIIASSTFLTVATRYGMPVSTTHSIVGGLVGSGVASVGWSKISWGWNGVSQVFGTWVIAPGIAAVISAVLFLITKYFVLTARNAVKHAFLSIPAYTFLTFAALTSKCLVPCARRRLCCAKTAISRAPQCSSHGRASRRRSTSQRRRS